MRAEREPNRGVLVDEVKLFMVARADMPEVGIQRGDLLRWEPTAGVPEPFVLARRRTFDYGVILVGLDTGQLDPVVLRQGASSSELRRQLQESAAQALRPSLRLHRSMG